MAEILFALTQIELYFTIGSLQCSLRNYINNHNIVFYLESMWTLTNIVRYLVNASPRILTWVRFTLINI